MPWGIAAAAVGTIAGAAISSNGAKDAAQTQANAANNATQLQMNEYNQTQNEYAPQRALGTGADSLLAQLYGVNLGGSVGASQIRPARRLRVHSIRSRAECRPTRRAA